MSIYDYSVKNSEGKEVSLKVFEGKLLMIVNTATKCIFTPHYEKLEAIYEKYHDLGFDILDIPCNQFGEEAPGTNEEIRDFCTLNYKTQFEQMAKSDVNGKDELPLYTYLKKQKGFTGFGSGLQALAVSAVMLFTKKKHQHQSDIKWNFTKFLVSRSGEVIARFEPTVDMEVVDQFIKQHL